MIAVAHARHREVGICGEAPSNYPEFAAWLAALDIDCITVNPDALLRVASAIAETALTKAIR